MTRPKFKLPNHRLLGSLWLIFGLLGFGMTAWDIAVIAMRDEFGFRDGFYDLTWLITQGIFPIFFVLASILGISILLQRRSALGLLKTLGPILLLYCIAYSIFGGERSWWHIFLGAQGIGLGGLSIVAAFFRQR